MSLRDPNVVNPTRRKRIAIVISNPAVSTTTGSPVGFWWSELTHPFFKFTEEGYDVEVFSASGGKCEADGMSDPRDVSGYSSSDLISMGFIATPSLAALVENTKPASAIGVDDFDTTRRLTYRRNLWLSMKRERWLRLFATALPFCGSRNSATVTIWERARRSQGLQTWRKISPTMPSGA